MMRVTQLTDEGNSNVKTTDDEGNSSNNYRKIELCIGANDVPVGRGI